jgi:hypothetical protein
MVNPYSQAVQIGQSLVDMGLQSSSRTYSIMYVFTPMRLLLMHQIPVRYAALSATPPAVIFGACRKVVESLALVRPDIKWDMWEERPSVGTAAGGPKKIISINGV